MKASLTILIAGTILSTGAFAAGPNKNCQQQANLNLTAKDKRQQSAEQLSVFEGAAKPVTKTQQEATAKK